MSEFCKILKKNNEIDILVYKGYNKDTKFYFLQIIKPDQLNVFALRTFTIAEQNKVKINEIYDTIDYLKAIQILNAKVK